jgi:hypothetical protein
MVFSSANVSKAARTVGSLKGQAHVKVSFRHQLFDIEGVGDIGYGSWQRFIAADEFALPSLRRSDAVHLRASVSFCNVFC